jgi:hypothetical protein
MPLKSSVMPESRQGRKPRVLDSELIAELLEALREAPLDSDADPERPIGYGPEKVFQTEAKAQSDYKPYRKAIGDALGVTVNGNVYSAEFSETGDAGFSWRLYIPLSAMDDHLKKVEAEQE